MQQQVQQDGLGLGHSQDAPILIVALICLCLVAMLLDAQSNALNAKTIALLGVLISINCMLRFIGVAIPGPGGFTPIFFLIILSGFVFGSRFGFLTGSLSLLTSAFITGGVGPWLPFQMFTAGWMGLTAGMLGSPAIKRLNARARLVILVMFGASWGFLYGAIMNVWFWPFADNPVQQSWQSGLAFADVLSHYAAFYAVTSLVWDTFAALGNGVFLMVFGTAAVRVLERAQRRFMFVSSS